VLTHNYKLGCRRLADPDWGLRGKGFPDTGFWQRRTAELFFRAATSTMTSQRELALMHATSTAASA